MRILPRLFLLICQARPHGRVGCSTAGEGTNPQAGDLLVIRVGDHPAEALPVRVGNQEHRVPLLSRLGGKGFATVTGVDDRHAVTNGDDLTEPPGVLGVGLTAAVGEPQQVQHYDRSVWAFGDEPLQIRFVRVDRHFTPPITVLAHTPNVQRSGIWP